MNIKLIIRNILIKPIQLLEFILSIVFSPIFFILDCVESTPEDVANGHDNWASSMISERYKQLITFK